MLREQTKQYVSGLSDAELVEYIITGQRMYEAEAVEFAKLELTRRELTPERIEELRRPVETKVLTHDARESTIQAPISGRGHRSPSILCTGCGVETPTRFVEYHQNIGALVIRFSKSYRGDFCGRCNRRAFGKATLTTFFLGWWGFISFFTTVAYLIANTITMLRTLSVPSPSADASRPLLDDFVVARMAPHANNIVRMLVEGNDPNEIARTIALDAGVTPGQAVLYVYELWRRQTEQAWEAQKRIGGFPVIMPAQSN